MDFFMNLPENNWYFMKMEIEEAHTKNNDLVEYDAFYILLPTSQFKDFQIEAVRFSKFFERKMNTEISVSCECDLFTGEPIIKSITLEDGFVPGVYLYFDNKNYFSGLVNTPKNYPKVF